MRSHPAQRFSLISIAHSGSTVHSKSIAEWSERAALCQHTRQWQREKAREARMPRSLLFVSYLFVSSNSSLPSRTHLSVTNGNCQCCVFSASSLRFAVRRSNRKRILSFQVPCNEPLVKEKNLNFKLVTLCGAKEFNLKPEESCLVIDDWDFWFKITSLEDQRPQKLPTNRAQILSQQSSSFFLQIVQSFCSKLLGISEKRVKRESEESTFLCLLPFVLLKFA